MKNCPPLASWLLDRLDTCGAREALVGDVLEEIARGRSHAWMWQQVLALSAVTAIDQVRHHTHISVPLTTLTVGIALLCGLSADTLARVLTAWAMFYMAAGTLSLFGHLFSSRAEGWRPLALP